MLPPPNQIGLPPKFVRWRPHQDTAIEHVLDSTKRVSVVVVPTGGGKSPLVVGAAKLGGYGRTAILTVRKGLQSQYLADFGEYCGLVDIRGQSNYRCKALVKGGEFYGQGIVPGEQCNAGPCHAGARCSLRAKGCDYFDAVQRAKASDRVVANYPYWIHIHRYADGLGDFGLLILDEAHDAPDELAAALEVHISDFDVELLTGIRLPRHERPEEWKSWAHRVRTAIAAKIGVNSGDDPLNSWREAHLLKSLDHKLTVISQMEGNWLVERRPHGARFAPVWPAPYAERFLFLDIPKIIIVSATIREKTLELLGIPPEQYEFREYPSTFPVSRRPVRFVPSVRVNHRWTDTEQKTWVRRLDQIIDRRLDRKGIVHTTSYERRSIIFTYSEHRGIMHTNDGSDTDRIVREFRAAAPPAVLVTPSLTSGWDLPLEDCEYCVIAKVPFLDTRSPIVKARTESDPDYSAYVAMQAIVQSAGRGMRSEEDQCEIIILDDCWKFFWFKYRHFAPQWFAAAVQRPPVTVPSPLPKLNLKQRR